MITSTESNPKIDELFESQREIFDAGLLQNLTQSSEIPKTLIRQFFDEIANDLVKIPVFFNKTLQLLNPGIARLDANGRLTMLPIYQLPNGDGIAFEEVTIKIEPKHIIELDVGLFELR